MANELDLLRKYLENQDSSQKLDISKDPASLNDAVSDMQSQLPPPPISQQEMPNPIIPPQQPLQPLDSSKFKDTEMDEAVSERNRLAQLASILEGTSRIGTALATGGRHTAKELGTSDFSNLQKLGQIGVEGVSDKRRAQDFAMKREQDIRDLIDVSQKSDPSSQRSSFYRSLVSQSMPSIPKETIEKMSATDIEKTFPFIAKIAEREEKIEQKGLDRQQKESDRALKEKELQLKMDQAKSELQAKTEAAKQAAEDRRLAREEANKFKELLYGQKAELQKERLEDKREQDTEKAIQKLEKEVSGTQEVFSAIGDIEGKLGFKLDDADISKGKIKVKETDAEGREKLKEKDLPGVNIPGVGSVSFYSGPARELDASISRVFNTVLKDRSGAAVTTPEMDRLKTEFNQGKFSTESDKIKAIKDYKGVMEKELQRRQAGFKPEVVKAYQQRGGMVAPQAKKPASTEKMPANTEQKQIVRKQYSKSANKTKVTYSDGSEEILDGMK